MTKRKKKPNPAIQRKIAESQHRNEYINQLKELLDKALGPDVFPLIPQREMERIYITRCNPVRIKAAPGHHFTSSSIQEAQRLVTFIFKRNFVHIGIGEVTEMSLYDFFSIGYTMMLYAGAVAEEMYPNAAEIKKRLTPFDGLQYRPVYQEAWKLYGGYMNVLSLWGSDITTHLIVLKHRDAFMGKDNRLGWCTEMYSHQTPKMQVVVDGHQRPAYRLGWFVPAGDTPHMEFNSVRSEILGLPPGDPLPVYIQSHALNRLAERLDGLDKGILHFNIFESFNQLVCRRNRNGDRLFEYKIFNNKAGYFTGEVVNGQLVLTTFLFITNNGTPESEKLYTTMGLMKEDKSYLAIDKLSTFLNSDIAGNERVKQLFIQAGCESLFIIDVSLYRSEGKGEKAIASLIEKYLQLDTRYMPVPTVKQNPVGWKKKY